jgi:CRP/FNR family transcriptional regulator, cyclic AMP receptor protein
MPSLPSIGSMSFAKKAIRWPHGKRDFLRCLPVEAIEDFECLAWHNCCPAHTLLFTEGDMPSAVSILLEGEVRLSVNSVGGKRFILRMAQPGEILGLASAFSGHSSEMTAEALYPCDTVQLRCADFLGFLDRHPPVFQFAVRELSLYYEQAIVRLRTMGVATVVASKLARLLLEWSVEGNQKDQRSLIRLALTHTEIGECIGTSRETVSRILAKFQRQAIVEMRGSALRIIDRPALEECAGVSEQELRRPYESAVSRNLN